MNEPGITQDISRSHDCYYPECDDWAELVEDPAQTDLWGNPVMIMSCEKHLELRKK